MVWIPLAMGPQMIIAMSETLLNIAMGMILSKPPSTKDLTTLSNQDPQRGFPSHPGPPPSLFAIPLPSSVLPRPFVAR